MKIIFLKDIPKVGRKYEVKDVADGYGRHLISSKLAEVATPTSLLRVEKLQLRTVSEQKMHEELLKKNLETIQGTKVTLARKANEKGHLFASIHKDEVLKELQKETRIELPGEYMLLEKPIKELGVHDVSVVVGKHSAVFQVVVESL